ncbi:MAG: isochorismatase family protein [Candidatus Kaiserbacteria bacterium]|nr:isochorismatase family protein [Candidatus Kaiserbacteria bacterium]MCB9816639.1 isochorismatase family protein [Candidatus Nomurabacteria bacterium]
MNESLMSQLRVAVPIATSVADISGEKPGLVIVDENNGFCTVGAGNLAPVAQDDDIDSMIDRTCNTAKAFLAKGWPVLVFLDSHVPGVPEHPYPPHCEQGTGEDELVPALQWLMDADGVTIMPKDCINGFVGGINIETNANMVVDWVNANGLTAVVVEGICTDICDMDFVLSMLSARNHGRTLEAGGGYMPTLQRIIVDVPGTATYDLPRGVAEEIGLPSVAAHPRDVTDYMGLYFMASRGAELASDLVL